MIDILEIHPQGCSFSWEKLMEMKEQEIEFWAGDGLTRLRMLDADVRKRRIHMITHKGEKTWPLGFQKLEDIHNKIHNGEIAPIAHQIDKHAPLWGNNIMGLLRYLGCLDTWKISFGDKMITKEDLDRLREQLVEDPRQVFITNEQFRLLLSVITVWRPDLKHESEALMDELQGVSKLDPLVAYNDARIIELMERYFHIIDEIAEEIKLRGDIELK